MHNKRTKLSLLLLAIVGCAGFAYTLLADQDPASRLLYAGVDHNDKPLRLHVLANSDLPEDQQLKLEVRDQVIGLLEQTLANCDDKYEAMDAVSAALPQIEKACNDYLAIRGSSYTASASLELDDFPAIDYNGDIYAAGEYDALRIRLGEGQGHNWWCVLFPPLCFVDLAAEADEEAVIAAMNDGTQVSGYRLDWKLSNLWSRE